MRVVAWVFSLAEALGLVYFVFVAFAVVAVVVVAVVVVAAGSIGHEARDSGNT